MADQNPPGSALPVPLSASVLCHRCDATGFDFSTTADLADIEAPLGQERALEAIAFGARMARPGYNLFVFGPSGTGKHSMVMDLLGAKAATEEAPRDWVYVNDFSAPHRPRVLPLPTGRGAALRLAMQRLVEDIRTAIPAAFETDDYRNRSQSMDEQFRERQEEAFDKLRKEAQARDAVLMRTPMGFALAPLKQGEVLKPEVFERLPREERERMEKTLEELQHKLEAIMRELPRWDRERREAVRTLNREVTAFTIDHPIGELRNSFADLPDVVAHLDVVRDDLVENVHGILGLEAAAKQETAGMTPSPMSDGFRRYQVNLVVDNAGRTSAPVVYEDNPTLANLIGRVEHVSQMGALVTDFTMIKPGALHRANGGYLILDAFKLLTQPFAWEALKRNLAAGKVKVESAGDMLSLVSTVSLEPEPIPLTVKLVLCGEPWVYYLLSTVDPDFPSLFKVGADFDSVTRRDEAAEMRYARLLATIVRREELKALDREAVTRVIEHGARLAGDGERLSLRLEALADLLREADFHAGDGRVITRAHVQAALDARERRADRLRERVHDAIERGIVLIRTQGEAVGQVNALSVYQLGEFAFGAPTRITAGVRMGGGKVVDIEREVELGGPLHTKGVLILSGFISARYATEAPLSLAASLVFEQSYGGVDGDSASSAELYALLSALSGAPVRQSLAVTGSVNQYGEVQAIGGVNEKIEGFFDVCRRRGLDGKQGVLVPQANVVHLMLREDVIRAVAEGRFHVWPVSTIDQGIELLTGRPAGARDAAGHYPEGTVNRLVEDRLVAFAEARRRLGEGGEGTRVPQAQPVPKPGEPTPGKHS